MNESGYINLVKSLVDYETPDADIRNAIYVAQRQIKTLLQYNSQYYESDVEFTQWADAFDKLNFKDAEHSIIKNKLIFLIETYNDYNPPRYHPAQCMVKAVVNKCAKILEPHKDKNHQLQDLYILTNNKQKSTLAKFVFVTPEI